MSAPTRNAGAIALARTGKSQTAIAELLGVSKVTVHHWCTGEKKPGQANRARLFELFGIPVSAWDESQSPRTPPATNIDADDVGGVFGMAKELEAMARQQLRELHAILEKPLDERTSTPLEVSRVMASLAPTLNQIAKLTGQHDLGRRMLQLPIWKRIEAELAEALRPYPEAAAAVAERFERLS